MCIPHFDAICQEYPHHGWAYIGARTSRTVSKLNPCYGLDVKCLRKRLMCSRLHLQLVVLQKGDWIMKLLTSSTD
jgi:hypothetical protein